MKQTNIFDFIKKIDQNEIENQKKLLNENVKPLCQKSINFLRKRKKSHLVDGRNYSSNQVVLSKDLNYNQIDSSIVNNKLSSYQDRVKRINDKLNIKKIIVDCDNKENISANTVPNLTFKSVLEEYNNKSDENKEKHLILVDCFNDDFKWDENLIGNKFQQIFPNKIQDQDFYFCVINNVESVGNVKQLTVTIENDNNNNKCQVILNLDGMWEDTVVNVGDICSIIDPIKSHGLWTINNHRGMLVVNSFYLVSTTSVTGSLFCQRKVVLQHFFSGMSGHSNKAMVIGSFVHLIFQECCRLEHLDLNVIREIVKRFLKQPSQLITFYESEWADEEIWKEIEIYLPRILEWINKNISKKPEFNKMQVVDIEENIWSPKYGVKGKIDVTLQTNESIIPFELKTGRTTFSREHTCQVLLYILMMGNKAELNIDKGLLLYIKDGSERFIFNDNSPSVISTIKIRNELTNYILKFTNSQLTNSDCLPPVINSTRLCQTCEYLSLCTIFSRLSQDDSVYSQSMKDLIKNNTGHLCDKDYEFFVHWINLIILEFLSEGSNENPIRNIILQNSNKSLRNVTFESSSHNGINFLIKFNLSQRPFYKFVEGDPIIVSSEDSKKMAIVLGYIVESPGDDFLIISSEKPLICSKMTKLRIDLNSSLKIPISNLSVLGSLMDKSEISQRLRDFIVHSKPPLFDSKITKSLAEKIKHIMKTCNPDQRRVIMSAIFSKDYLLIKGYPGSGKTSCIVAMIRIFVLMRMKVLVSSYTHSAVSNILQKLDSNEINFLYLNGNHSVSEKLKNRTLSYILVEKKIENLLDFHNLIENIDVVGVTCLSANHAALSRLKFDVVIIDEAGQITLPISIMPLLKMDENKGKFILTGDLFQLPPLVRNFTARTKGLDQSLFSKLCEFNHPNCITELKLQYRMNIEILKLCNTISYNNQITCATDQVSFATIMEHESINNLEFWKRQCCSSELNRSVIFLNYQPSFVESDEIYFNKFEARIAMELLEQLLKIGILESDIGVIIPYNQQKEMMKIMSPLEVEINTIDQYQGRDKSIVIISFVSQSDKPGKTHENNSYNILNDQRRLNVAISRAKHKLIMIGNLNHLSQNYQPIKVIRDVLLDHQIIPI